MSVSESADPLPEMEPGANVMPAVGRTHRATTTSEYACELWQRNAMPNDFMKKKQRKRNTNQ